MARDSSCRRGSTGARLFAVEQLVIAEHDDWPCALSDSRRFSPSGIVIQRPSRNPACTWPDDQAQPIRLRKLALRQHFAEPFLLRFVVAGDQHEIVGRGAVEFVAHLA